MPHRTPRALTRWAIALYLCLYAPLFVLIALSFLPAEAPLRWEELTWRWYQAVWQHQPLLKALLVSLAVSLPAVLIATAIGTLTALALHRMPLPGRALVQALLYLPLIMPALVLGVALLLFFVAIHLPLGIFTVILAHVACATPLTTLVVLARLQRLDRSLEDAALDLGADEWTTFWRITLPLLRPGILAAALLALPWSFNDLVITFFVTGAGASTLPIRMYGMIKVGVSPMVTALGTLMVILPLLVVLLGTQMARRPM